DAGLYDFRARPYDAGTGRFLSEDPIFAPNLYPVVGNGITYRTDPSGTTQAGNPLSNLNLNRYTTLAESDSYFRNQLYSPSSLATSRGPSPYAVAAYQDATRRYDLAQAQKIQQMYADADLNWRIDDPILTNSRVQSTFTILQGVGEATIATGLAAVPEPTLA